MAFTEGGSDALDQVRALQRGADPEVFLEWSAIIEKRSKEACGDLMGARIIFRGTVDEERRFALDVDASDSDATLCLLKTIQSCLDLMPAITREFYGALLGALTSEAGEKGVIGGPWHV